jgi:hypothetical protein
MSSLPNLSAKDARRLGVLQEINRRLLHPRGMALSVDVASGVFQILVDDDLEGWGYDWDAMPEQAPEAHDKAKAFDDLLKSRTLRESVFGDLIQPLPEIQDVTIDDLPEPGEDG